MTAAVPTYSELTCVLPPQILALGEALAPVAKAARHELARRVRPSGQAFNILDDLVHHMGVVEHALTKLSPRLDGLMTDVIRNAGAGVLEAGRSAGRLEQVLSELVEGYLEAKASHAGPEDAKARVLMMGVYRHHIRLFKRDSSVTWRGRFPVTWASVFVSAHRNHPDAASDACCPAVPRSRRQRRPARSSRSSIRV